MPPSRSNGFRVPVKFFVLVFCSSFLFFGIRRTIDQRAHCGALSSSHCRLWRRRMLARRNALVRASEPTLQTSDIVLAQHAPVVRYASRRRRRRCAPPHRSSAPTASASRSVVRCARASPPICAIRRNTTRCATSSPSRSPKLKRFDVSFTPVRVCVGVLVCF